jgi:hypothetical protein
VATQPLCGITLLRSCHTSTWLSAAESRPSMIPRILDVGRARRALFPRLAAKGLLLVNVWLASCMLGVITNEMHTNDDSEFLRHNAVLPDEQIVADVEMVLLAGSAANSLHTRRFLRP